jgi:hypothetical protein
MKRNCNECGRSYQAQRPQSKFCKPSCRVRHSRKPKSVPVTSGKERAGPDAISIDQGEDLANEGESSPLVIATRKRLEAAGVADSMEGQQALSIATQMSGRETAGGMASLSKELSRVMAEAMRAAVPLMADSMDELKARREAKRSVG